ncbi:hypothetical protein BC833DRAFT_570136 [Globomyces pollinis-pini]|nr:hypothetical protein BC833DRAFT_570136 [Globomyces pollinis-pini]
MISNKIGNSEDITQHKIPGTFGSGVLLYWCGEHRFCIGFSVLEKAESLQELASNLTKGLILVTLKRKNTVFSLRGMITFHVFSNSKRYKNSCFIPITVEVILR